MKKIMMQSVLLEEREKKENEMDVKNKIQQFIRTEIPIAREIANLESTDLVTNGIIDSLAIMKLIAFLEETFSIRLEDEEIVAENFETIETISSLVKKKE